MMIANRGGGSGVSGSGGHSFICYRLPARLLVLFGTQSSESLNQAAACHSPASFAVCVCIIMRSGSSYAMNAAACTLRGVCVRERGLVCVSLILFYSMSWLVDRG